MPHASEIVAEIAPTGGTNITMHDGSVLRFTRVPADYDVSDRQKAFSYLKNHPNEVVTGILFADESVPDLHETNHTPATALWWMCHTKNCAPGAVLLEQLQNEFR